MHQFWFSTSNLCFINPYIVISPKYNSTLIYVCFKIWIWNGCYDAISKHLNVLRTGTLAIWNKIYRLSNLHGGIIPLIFARGSQVHILDWDIKWFDLNLFHLFTPTHTYIIHFHLCCRCQETGHQRSHVDIIRRINIYLSKNCICSECRTGGLWIVELNTQAFSSWLQHSWYFQWAGFSHGPSSPAGRVRIGPGSPTGRVRCGPGSLVFVWHFTRISHICVNQRHWESNDGRLHVDIMPHNYDVTIIWLGSMLCS